MIWRLFEGQIPKLLYCLNQKNLKNFCWVQKTYLANYMLRKTEYIITNHKMWVMNNIENKKGHNLRLKYIPSKEKQLY